MSETNHPIRGLRTMAIVRWAILVLVAVLAVGTWWTFVFEHDHASDGRADRYYCPMHPDIRSPDPGSCPICYMSLELIPDSAPSAGGSDPVLVDEPPSLAPVMLTTERRQRAGIATTAARRASIATPARWPASIEVNEGARAEVRLRAEGYVERITVGHSRASVRRGQVLAWIYSPDIVRAQEELLVAARWTGEESPVAAARQRLILLGVSDRDIDATIERGRAERTVPVRAPISGEITRFEAVVGSYVTPSTLLYEITDFSSVRVVATPLERDLSWLGPKLEARFEPRGGEPVPLTFELLEPELAADTRASRVRFTANGARLRPNAIGEVWIERPAREALLVPRDAVIDTGAQRYVFVERQGGLFEPREVQLGALDGEDRVITAGLEEGEAVVARGAFVLDSESRLQAALAPAPHEHEGDHERETTEPTPVEHEHGEHEHGEHEHGEHEVTP